MLRPELFPKAGLREIEGTSSKSKECVNGWIGQAARSENTSQSFRPLIWINAHAVQSAMVALSERKPT